MAQAWSKRKSISELLFLNTLLLFAQLCSRFSLPEIQMANLFVSLQHCQECSRSNSPRVGEGHLPLFYSEESQANCFGENRDRPRFPSNPQTLQLNQNCFLGFVSTYLLVMVVFAPLLYSGASLFLTFPEHSSPGNP